MRGSGGGVVKRNGPGVTPSPARLQLGSVAECVSLPPPTWAGVVKERLRGRDGASTLGCKTEHWPPVVPATEQALGSLNSPAAPEGSSGDLKEG